MGSRRTKCARQKYAEQAAVRNGAAVGDGDFFGAFAGFTPLYVFTINGIPMAGLVIAGNHTLYGTTAGDGPFVDGNGAVFSLSSSEISSTP